MATTISITIVPFRLINRKRELAASARSRARAHHFCADFQMKSPNINGNKIERATEQSCIFYRFLNDTDKYESNEPVYTL